MGTNDTSVTPGAGQSTELQQESSNTGGTAGSEADIHEPGNTPAAKGPKPAKGKRENTSIFDSDEKTPITSNFSISKILGPIAIVFTIVVLLAIILYLKKFASPIFSDDKDHWTQFGNFFAAVLNPYLSALLVITTVYIAWWLNNYEKKRDAALKKEADVKSYLELYQYYTSPEFREKRTIAWQVLVRAIENDEYAEYLVDQAFAGRYGASEYQDIKAAGEWLAARADVDASRIGVYGGSYGGYLTALALGRDSDLFAAGVDVHGVHNYIGRIPPVSAEPAPDAEKAIELARLSSPVTYVDTWKSPVLLIHGDDDANVDFSQTLDLLRRLEERGVPHETLMIPDETHHWMLYRHQVQVDQAVADFLLKNLQNPQGSN